ncbi:MAG: MarR family winged helix-turn-helix transcriptional regulator [Coprobacillus sp.]
MDRRVGLRIHYLANQNRAYVNALLKETGLTHAECNLITEINRNEGLSQEDVRKSMRIDKSAITRIIKSMIEKGYVSREINEHDHRYSCLYLTTKAKDQLDYIYHIFKKSSDWMLEGLNDEEVKIAIELLDKMCASVRKKVDQYE